MTLATVTQGPQGPAGPPGPQGLAGSAPSILRTWRVVSGATGWGGNTCWNLVKGVELYALPGAFRLKLSVEGQPAVVLAAVILVCDLDSGAYIKTLPVKVGGLSAFTLPVGDTLTDPITEQLDQTREYCLGIAFNASTNAAATTGLFYSEGQTRTLTEAGNTTTRTTRPVFSGSGRHFLKAIV